MVLDRVDRTYSRFRPDSELAILNSRAGADMPMSPLLAAALAAAIRAARLSDGLVDPTVGRAMRLVGYDDDFSRVVGRRELLDLRLEPVPGWQTVVLDPVGRTVRTSSGVELDLGSSGKAFAADLAAGAAHEASGAGVLVSLGGDIATAGEPPGGGWRVLVTDDSESPPDADGEVIAVHGGALATSSTTVRRWTRGGVGLHHLIDPRTGLPAVSPWRTVSVLAGACVDANTAATAAIILGPEAPAWLEERGLDARLAAADGTVRRVGAWPIPAGVER